MTNLIVLHHLATGERPTGTPSASCKPAAGGSPRQSRYRHGGIARAGLVLLALCAGLTACGGGGGGAAGGAVSGNGLVEAQAGLGVLKVSVVDTHGAAVAGASVQGPRGNLMTDAQGVALLLVDRTASASVNVTRQTFIDQSLVAPLSPTGTSDVTVTLLRVTSAAGGSLASRSGVLPLVDAGAQEMAFEIELVIVDGDSRPIENLRQTDFTLRACTPDASNTLADCLRGPGSAGDVAYTPTAASPASLALIPGLPASPYAAALLLDQSGSIATSDPSGARLFAAKGFMGALGAGDHVLLAAFASGPNALIATPPLTTYPPFRDRTNANSYFATLDLLGTQVGGNTPLYDALDTLRPQLVNEPSIPATTSRAIVVFTDGTDTLCADVQACRTRRELAVQGANNDQVRLFTIGLSSGIDVAALGELATQTGGAFLYADTAEQLLPLYGSLGRLLSLSLPTYRMRWTVRTAAPGALASGNTLLGRVQVSANGKVFDVPFVVAIP